MSESNQINDSKGTSETEYTTAHRRVLVCGGRNFHDQTNVYEWLDCLHMQTPIGLIIHGDAKGADRLGGQWAESRGIDVEVYPANWRLFGRRAGYIRNQQMLREGKPDQVMAFPGGVGTKMMRELAAEANVPVINHGWTLPEYLQEITS